MKKNHLDILAIVLSLLSLILSLIIAYIQNNVSYQSLLTAQDSNILSEKIAKDSANLTKKQIDNSQMEFELVKKQIAFTIIQELYKELYTFFPHNIDVINKIHDNKSVSNTTYLKLYLNSFESIYDQCSSGLIKRSDIYLNFRHLIEPTCNHQQVIEETKDGYNGLHIMCSYFNPRSEMAKVAKIEKEDCL